MTNQQYAMCLVSVAITLLLLFATYHFANAQSAPGGCYVGRDGEVWCVQAKQFLPVVHAGGVSGDVQHGE